MGCIQTSVLNILHQSIQKQSCFLSKLLRFTAEWPKYSVLIMNFKRRFHQFVKFKPHDLRCDFMNFYCPIFVCSSLGFNFLLKKRSPFLVLFNNSYVTVNLCMLRKIRQCSTKNVRGINKILLRILYVSESSWRVHTD